MLRQRGAYACSVEKNQSRAGSTPAPQEHVLHLLCKLACGDEEKIKTHHASRNQIIILILFHGSSIFFGAGRREDASSGEHNHENIKLRSSGELGNGRRHSRGVARAFSRCAYLYRHSEQCATIEEKKKSVMSRAPDPGRNEGGTILWHILANLPHPSIRPPSSPATSPSHSPSAFGFSV